MTEGFKRTLIWIVGSMLAVMVSMAMLSAAFDGRHYVPVSNDSFYHAHRILDAVAHPSGYYEFDPRIHAPDGALLTWPWAYDLGVAWLVRGALALGLGTDAVKIMDYVPVAAVPFAIALILTIAVQLRLSTWSQAVAVACVALSPLTQILFGVGLIDHHYLEYLFALGTLSAGLGWLEHPGSGSRALLLGLVLGIAPAFQNGLFILQLPLLVTLAILHLHGTAPPRRSTLVFAAALLLATLCMLLPSQPFREGRFAYYYFSWFHLYVAACSALFAVLLSRLNPGRRATLIFVLAGCALAVPLAKQVLLGGNYFAAHLENRYNIGEVQTLWQQLRGDGLLKVLDYYSGLLFLLPLVLVGCGWYLFRRGHNAPYTLLCVTSVFGLLMLMSKFRLQNFGSFALFLPPLCALEHWLPQRSPRRSAVLAAASLILLVAFLPPLTQQLFIPKWLAKSQSYALTSDIYPTLHEACAAQPGIVLASNDDGHYITYHSACSVIADNFMLTRQDADSIATMERLFSLTPAGLLEDKLPIRYVYARLNLVDRGPARGGLAGSSEAEVRALNAPLVNSLIFTPVSQLDPHYHLIRELRWTGVDTYPYARLFEIVREPRGAGP
ncbi:MAG TPA: hypothetical protein VMI92_12160 [Steroidobacteraceae bacterium]|nr:hypothetical protein [Steroidobacteraceae bacterium]